MQIELYDYTFDAVIDPLYRLNASYNVEIVLFELLEDGYRQHTVQSSNQSCSTKNFKAQTRYEGTTKEVPIQEVAIEALQRRYNKYLKEGYTEDLATLELERIKKIKEKLTARYNYLKKLRKESLTKVPKKFVWYTYKETASPIKVLYDD